MVLPWRLMTWDGGAWVNAELKRWDGSSFVAANMYFWDGGAWILCTDRTPPTTTHNDTFNSTASQNYEHCFDTNVKRTDQPQRLYQGYFSADRGMQSSLVLFDDAAIRAAVTGYVAVYDAQMYMDNTHCWNGSFTDVGLAPHAANTIPNNINFVYGAADIVRFNIDEFKFFSVTQNWIWYFRDSVARSVQVWRSEFDAYLYAYHRWVSGTDFRIFFSYEK